MGSVDLLYTSLIYVANQNMFFGSMGFTTGMGMLVGVLLYDGNLKNARKGVVAVLTYVIMLLWTTAVRILPNAIRLGFHYHDGRPFAGIATTIYITIAWMLGVWIGVRLFKHHKFND